MNWPSKLAGHYNAVPKEMLTCLPPGATTILDVVCGSGDFGELLKEKTQAELWRIENVEDKARKPQSVLNIVFQGEVLSE